MCWSRGHPVAREILLREERWLLFSYAKQNGRAFIFVHRECESRKCELQFERHIRSQKLNYTSKVVNHYFRERNSAATFGFILSELNSYILYSHCIAKFDYRCIKRNKKKSFPIDDFYLFKQILMNITQFFKNVHVARSLRLCYLKFDFALETFLKLKLSSN